MQTTIRSATKEDLSALLTLYHHLNPADPALAPQLAQSRFDEMLAHPGMIIFVAEASGTLAASCTLIIIPNLTRAAMPYALIENVITHGDFRKQGLGRKVLQHAVDKAFENGCYKVMLMTGRSDPGVLKFYESCGFQQNKTGFQVRNPG
jgi:GNAT superfamily N-acetyltransferase